jgi:hypothetical protein
MATDAADASYSRRVTHSGALAARAGAVDLVLGLAGVLAISAASQAAEPNTHKAKTLRFDVVFSPFSPIAANNVRDPDSPFVLGDELIFHDQFFAIAGPTPRELALTGSTGSYRSVGGEGTLVEFGNGKGRMTLQVVSLVPEARELDARHGHAARWGCRAHQRPHPLAGDELPAYLARGPRRRICPPVRAGLLERITSPPTVGSDLGKRRSAQG